MAKDASTWTSSGDSYIDRKISLTSKTTLIRYEGIVCSINPVDSSIGLRYVRAFGSEGRLKVGPQIPACARFFEFLLFHGCDIMDFQVKSSVPMTTAVPILDDPAIISVRGRDLYQLNAKFNAKFNSTPSKLMQVNKKEDKQGTKEINLDELIVADLPPEIWRDIGTRLESGFALSRFRSVCHTLRSCLPGPSRFPLRVPSPQHNAFSHWISEVTFYATNESILMFEEKYQRGKFSVSAFVPEKQASLSMKFELPPVSEISNLTFLSKAYQLHNNDMDSFYSNTEVLKIVIISRDGAGSVNPNYSRLRDVKVVAHLIDGKLAVLSLCGGAMNNNWETCFSSKTSFDDIVSYRGQLYAVDVFGILFVMDYNTLHMTQVAALSYHNDFVQQQYSLQRDRDVMHLAVVSEDLYLFIEQYGYVMTASMYKLSSRFHQWIEADQDLPDRVFIRIVECNFAVSRDLLYRVMKNEPPPRFCSWPRFEFVPVAVAFTGACL